MPAAAMMGGAGGAEAAGGASGGGGMGSQAMTQAGNSAGGLTSIMGGIIGHFASQGDQDKANQLAQEAFQSIQNLGAPPDMAKQIIMQKFQAAGMLDPVLEQKIDAGVSQVAQIQSDPQLKAAQMSALQSFQKLSQTGLSPQERAQAEENLQQANQLAQQKTAQIQQSFQRQGQGGGGADLAAQLQAAQSGANSAQSGALGISSQAAQAKQNALAQMGGLAGQIEGQQFQEAATKGSAADQLNRFNVQNQQAQQARNVASQNQAQQYNIGNAQNLSNMNTQNYNQEQLRELQGGLQNWQNQVGLAQLKAGAGLGLSGQYGKQAAQTGAFWNGIGAGAGQMMGSTIKSGAFGGGGNSGGTPNGTSVNEGQYGTGSSGSNQGGFATPYWQGGTVQSYKDGGEVPGEAKYEGDHPGNDTVHAMLSPGEVVVKKTDVEKLNTAYKLIKHLLDKK